MRVIGGLTGAGGKYARLLYMICWMRVPPALCGSGFINALTVGRTLVKIPWSRRTFFEPSLGTDRFFAGHAIIIFEAGPSVPLVSCNGIKHRDGCRGGCLRTLKASRVCQFLFDGENTILGVNGLPACKYLERRESYWILFGVFQLAVGNLHVLCWKLARWVLFFNYLGDAKMVLWNIFLLD